MRMMDGAVVDRVDWGFCVRKRELREVRGI